MSYFSVLISEYLFCDVTSLHLAVRDLSCSEKDSSFLEACTWNTNMLVETQH